MRPCCAQAPRRLSGSCTPPAGRRGVPRPLAPPANLPTRAGTGPPRPWKTAGVAAPQPALWIFFFCFVRGTRCDWSPPRSYKSMQPCASRSQHCRSCATRTPRRSPRGIG
eukprot:3621419-Prymnesium_polylepis.2